MEETREERQKRIEGNSKRLSIRTTIENLHKMPGVSEDMRDKIQSAMKEFLPVLKDEIKIQIADQSARMGVGADKQSYMIRNGAEGLEFHILKNVKFALGTEKVLCVKAKTIMDRIDKYENPAALVADAITGRLFQAQEYVIGEEAEEKTAEQPLLENTDEQKLLTGGQ